MSRVGNKPIIVPAGVEVKIDQNKITLGKGDAVLNLEINPELKIEYDAAQRKLKLIRPTDNRNHRSLHGLFRTLINNMVVGVTQGYKRKLEIVGVGFRAEMKGKNLMLSLGYSHPILFKPPADIRISVEGTTNIFVSGADKQAVGQVAAKIRSFRPPEPYKGKGIRYEGEYVRHKAGKTAA